MRIGKVLSVAALSMPVLLSSLLACGGLKTTPPPAAGSVPQIGSISGKAQDSSGNALSGVSVQIESSSAKPSPAGSQPSQAVLGTATTDSEGSYTMTGLTVGDGYTVTYTLSAHVTIHMYNVSVTANATSYQETMRVVPESSSTGDVAGIITNALTGAVEAGVAVKLYPGVNVTSGTETSSTTTDADGVYGFTGVSAGNYTVIMSKTGMTGSSFTVYCVGGATTSNQNGSITPTPAEGETRIVLTWGATPYDLDSHLTGPYGDGSTSRFHVYYIEHSYSYGGSTYANLDVDDTSSYGPETTTIYHQSSGTYNFSVHDYTNRSSSSSSALGSSMATVKVYQSTGSARTFNVPGAAGTLWTVFTINGSTITPVNAMSYQSDPSSVTKPSR